MDKDKLLAQVKIAANGWLEGNFDVETKKQVKNLLDNDEKELIESFYCNLEFGTGGLRGIMGVGTNRMNIYTVGMATQGLSNYVKSNFGSLSEIKVAIAYDCRNNSKLFAETTAKIFAGNNFTVYLFESLRPTPELSYAIRQLGCQTGVVITASHNPKEYNGYKAYWDDGGQVVSPHDKNIIAEVQKIKSIDDIKFDGDESKIQILGKDFDEKYTDMIKELSLSPEIIAKHKDMKMVYTPIHGTGVELVPMALKKLGFSNIYNVAEQDVVDGNFPTVYSPNPEEPAALKMAIEKAESVDAELVMASDPDADRVGVAIKDDNGKFIILNGNQTASLITNYMLSQWQAKGKLTGKEFIVKTVVTTELLVDIAKKYNVDYFDVLTGFKWIADVIKKHEGEKTFICGGEESYGFMVGSSVRDKDAVSACALVAETAAWAKEQGKTLFELLKEIYKEFGFYLEDLVSVVKKGKDGAEEIQKMMAGYRSNPPLSINGSKVVKIADYQLQEEFNVASKSKSVIKLPKSNVLQFFTADGSKITVRPSGTEPKIKFYFGVKDELNTIEEYHKVRMNLEKKIESIKSDLGIN
jgi:phosphoglucomutase